MAFFDDLSPLGMVQLAAPNQAATIFNPDGPHPVRQKHLFVVRFVRAAGTSDAAWKNGLTFVVKSIDRPQVQPVVEEINQYNKKRLIHTGVKYSPINCTFFDTADNAAMNMWIDYARYYFGDYHQNEQSYQDDILNGDMMHDVSLGKVGYGFGIRQDAVNEGMDSQHFFDRVEVYQVWGNEFTSYWLMNPRINSFQPDDLAYESSEANTVAMSMSYEAIVHGNTGRSKDLLAEPILTSIFESGFHGQQLEILGPPKVNSFVGIASNFGTITNQGQFLAPDGQIGNEEILRTTTSSAGGVLNRFGTYDFGTLDRVLEGPLREGVSQAIGGSSTLANILRGNFSGGATQTITGGNHVSIEAAVGDAINYVDGLAQGIRAATKFSGQNASDLASREDGLQLSNAAVLGVNQTRNGTSQIGNKTSSNGMDTF